MNTLSTLTAISPVDGRYAEKTEPLRLIFSEYGLMRNRTIVEIRWLQTLANESAITEVSALSSDAQQQLEKIISRFDHTSAEKIKHIEKTTNHDVKAIEYFLKEQCANHPQLSAESEFIHFACTSEDINNLSYALMLKDARELVLVPQLRIVIGQLRKLIKETAHIPMLARTHGQAATPTTIGKEIANTVVRLQKELTQLLSIKIYGKFNGAVGNFNAHRVAYPNVNWPVIAEKFVTQLGLSYNSHTTQIEPHDYIANLCDSVARINTILIDFNRDVWFYISLGYFSQRAVATEVGSSTMPHKINPIDFENAEGNLGFANSMFNYFSRTLPISRMQRDLTDSTLLRNLGVAFSHTLIALLSCSKGISKLVANEKIVVDDLNAHPEILSEAIQTVMRRHKIAEPYEKLKAFTRGKTIDGEMIKNFIDQLALSHDVKQQLHALTPANYIGFAREFALEIADCTD